MRKKRAQNRNKSNRPTDFGHGGLQITNSKLNI